MHVQYLGEALSSRRNSMASTISDDDANGLYACACGDVCMWNAYIRFLDLPAVAYLLQSMPFAIPHFIAFGERPTEPNQTEPNERTERIKKKKTNMKWKFMAKCAASNLRFVRTLSTAETKKGNWYREFDECKQTNRNDTKCCCRFHSTSTWIRPSPPSPVN